MMRFDMGVMARQFGEHAEFTVPGTGGYYDDMGRWVPGEPPKTVRAVATILPMTAYDLQFYEAGQFTTEDVKVIVEGHVDLPLGTQFQRDGATYELRELRNYDRVANIRRYVAKRLREGSS